MMIKAIFFDLDGTLRFNDPPAIPAFHRFAAEQGVEASRESRRKAERWTYAYWASSETLRLDIEKYGDWDGNGAFWANHARRHLIELGAAEDRAEILAPVITQKMQENYEPVDCVPDDVIPTLRALRQNGCKLAVVSNRSKPFTETLARIGLDAFLDFSLSAGEAGYWKPDPRLLLHAAVQCDVEPAETVYVGDNPFADVAAARSAGMLPILIDPRSVFPDVDCLQISKIGELPKVLSEID
jgi:HAD superfamily hydrolase (TIGR01662 family)